MNPELSDLSWIDLLEANDSIFLLNYALIKAYKEICSYYIKNSLKNYSS